MTRTSYTTGLWAEAWCRWTLRLKGYRILASRYKSPHGEIDIIAKRGEVVALVEVKARGSAEDALFSILPRQQQRLQRGALDFMARHPHLREHTLRFDVMLVVPRRWPVHIHDAWRGD